MNDGSKIEKYIDTDDLPGFFRALADALEKGGSEEFSCIEDSKKIKINVKSEFGKYNVRVRFKTDNVCESPEDLIGKTAAKPEYSVLKKRMKGSFKMIFKMIHEGRIPPAGAVTSFLDDSALMVTYPGYGDEYYERYTEVCHAFASAYASGDLTAMKETAIVIAQEKGRCHTKYD